MIRIVCVYKHEYHQFIDIDSSPQSRFQYIHGEKAIYIIKGRVCA